MFDHEYFKQVDSEMLSALKVLGRAMLSALDALIWYCFCNRFGSTAG